MKLAESLDDHGSFRRFCGFSRLDQTQERRGFVRFRNALSNRSLDQDLLDNLTSQLKGKAFQVKTGIASPWVNTEDTQAHVNDIARHVATGSHAVLIVDRAAWRTTSKLMTPTYIKQILFPSRAPKLNPVENICLSIGANWLSNRIFASYDIIVEAICEAWDNLIGILDTIKSIRLRESVRVGRSESSLVLSQSQHLNRLREVNLKVGSRHGF